MTATTMEQMLDEFGKQYALASAPPISGVFTTFEAYNEARSAILARFAELERERDAYRADAERMEDALEQIKQWAQAYPLSVFQEPDFAKAHELLKAGGMTLDAISASNMRHVITQVQKIVDAAIAQRAGETG